MKLSAIDTQVTGDRLVFVSRVMQCISPVIARTERARKSRPSVLFNLFLMCLLGQSLSLLYPTEVSDRFLH